MGVEDQIGELTAVVRELMSRIDEGKGSHADGGRTAAAKDGIAESVSGLVGIDQANLNKAIADQVKAVLAASRFPSDIGAIGQGRPVPEGTRPTSRLLVSKGDVSAHPGLKAMFADYQGGELIGAVDAVSSLRDGFDPDRVRWGKAKLVELGIAPDRAAIDQGAVQGGYFTLSSDGKATLGNTGATGGYVLPNNLVDTLIKPNVQAAVYTATANPLVTVVPGVAVRGVDLPYRTGAPTKLTPQDWGQQKENLNEAYGSYTATLATFARIYDVGKQYLRFSQGSAENDVIDELTKAQFLAENFYTIAGAGTGTVGTGDPTVGVYTSLTSAGMGGQFTTAFTPSSSSVAGSFAAGLAQAFMQLGKRSRYPDAVVVDATTFWTAFSQGSDNAGFWMSELLGAGFQIGADNTLRWRGVPIYYDANLGLNAATKIAIVGEWKALKFFRGSEFRIDSTDVAGNRWDNNLVGFRGEEEFGINANAAVAVGAFQLVTSIIP
jgi:HK97 family phage major capsid protein